MGPRTAGASLHRRRQAVRPCTAWRGPCTGGAFLHRLPCSADASCAAVEIRKNDLEGVEGKPSGLGESLTPGAVLGSVQQQPSSSGSSLRPGFEAVKARHTGWGGSSEDAIPVTRLCSYIACLALSNSSSTLTGRRGLKCATPAFSDSAGRSPLRVGRRPARNMTAPREAYSGHVVKAANSSLPRRPSTS